MERTRSQSHPVPTPYMNPYCNALGIRVPRLEDVAFHRDANTYARLIVALLERGGPMTLTEVADRLQQVGLGPSSCRNSTSH